MTKIQLLLIAAIVSGALVASVTLGAKIVYRVSMFALMLLGVFFVALPQRTNEIAAFMGASLGAIRGTGLLLCLSIVAGTYALLLIYLRTRRLEQRLTQHVRAAAIQSAIPPDHLS